MKFIIDANVLVSAALFKGSIPDQAFDKARLIGTILTSETIYEELKEVNHRTKFSKYLITRDRYKFLSRYKAETQFVNIIHKVNICRDANDNKYLELALSRHADCIIRGDPDLQSLNPFKNIPIISPKEFLTRY